MLVVAIPTIGIILTGTTIIREYVHVAGLGHLVAWIVSMMMRITVNARRDMMNVVYVVVMVVVALVVLIVAYAGQLEIVTLAPKVAMMVMMVVEPIAMDVNVTVHVKLFVPTIKCWIAVQENVMILEMKPELVEKFRKE